MKKSFLLSALVLILAFGFIGCSDDSGGGSDPAYTVLQVTGIPSEKYVIGSSLIGGNEQPVAVGMCIAGTSNLYEPTSSTNYAPNSEKPWKGTGSYMVGLTEVDDPDTPIEDIISGNADMTQYIYVGFDVTALLAAFASYDPSDPMSSAGIMASLASNQQLVQQLMNMDESMMVSFNNSKRVTFQWNNFLPQSLLVIINDLMAMFQ
jgi:hypothetical protein